MENEITKRHIQVPSDMTEQYNYLKPGDILIYATLKRHMDKETKTCYPSLATISKESGASINTVKASIQNLVNSNPFKNAKVGDYVKIGNYSQGETGDIQPIEWLILSREENRILKQKIMEYERKIERLKKEIEEKQSQA